MRFAPFCGLLRSAVSLTQPSVQIHPRHEPEEMVKAALAALVQEREVYCTQFRGADYFYCNY